MGEIQTYLLVPVLSLMGLTLGKSLSSLDLELMHAYLIEEVG